AHTVSRILGVAVAVPLLAVAASCSSSSSPAAVVPPPSPDGGSDETAVAAAAFAASDWAGALASCQRQESAAKSACDGKYCEFVARSMQVVDQINTFL